MKYLISGATGFVGTHLLNHLRRLGQGVELISRRPHVGCDWTRDSLLPAIKEADVLVHLAGAGVMDVAWKPERKLELRRSREETTGLLAELCATAQAEGCAPRFVSASAVGYYGPRDNAVELDETADPGHDFLAQVCMGWEQALQPARDAGVEVCVARIGVVLGSDGGALKRMLLPFKLGLGGPLGTGRQAFPWIHVQDLVRLVAFLGDAQTTPGVFNAVAPGCVTQREFARALGRALFRPAIAPAPAWILKLALGKRASMLLSGQRVLPTAALAAGFEFEHGDLGEALVDLVAKG